MNTKSSYLKMDYRPIFTGILSIFAAIFANLQTWILSFNFGAISIDVVLNRAAATVAVLAGIFTIANVIVNWIAKFKHKQNEKAKNL